MAPEMFTTSGIDTDDKIVRGRPGDIWAAGITLYNLLTKKFPFTGRNILALAQNVKEKEPDLGLIGGGDGDDG